MKFHSFLEAVLHEPEPHAVQPWMKTGTSSAVLYTLSELSWTVLDWDLTTNCFHLDHMWGLSESKALHADT